MRFVVRFLISLVSMTPLCACCFFRVLFGSTNLFVFHHPQDFAKQQKDNKTVPAPSYDSAQEEIAKNSGLSKFTSGGKSKGLFLKSSFCVFFHLVLLLVVTNARDFHEYMDWQLWITALCCRRCALLWPISFLEEQGCQCCSATWVFYHMKHW